jgi:hypothetical protein
MRGVAGEKSVHFNFLSKFNIQETISMLQSGLLSLAKQAKMLGEPSASSFVNDTILEVGDEFYVR